MTSLGGTLFTYNAISQDYCFVEGVRCLQELCDQVVVVDAGSTDGTAEELKKLRDGKTAVIIFDGSKWNEMGKDRAKLSYFTNQAMSFLTTEWHINLQADEIIHENCFEDIRKAIASPTAQGYLVTRVNCWASTRHALNVTENRSPVGFEIIRLAKTGYPSYDDAQSLAVPFETNYLDKIRIYHYGFVRNKYVHCKKIKHMLTEVFGMDMDKKVEDMEGVFDPWKHFTKEDIIEIKEPTPVFVKEWAEQRDRINNFL